MPSAVCSGDTKLEHGLSIVGLSPGAGEFKALLIDLAMSAFDLARTDGQASVNE